MDEESNPNLLAEDDSLGMSFDPSVSQELDPNQSQESAVLGVSHAPSMSAEDNSLGMSFDPNLSVEDDSLGMSFDPKLSVEDDSLGMSFGSKLSVEDDSLGDVWSVIVGQPAAVAQLCASTAVPMHAYLLVGPRGSGKRAAAAVFAGELLVAADPRAVSNQLRIDRHRRLAAQNEHPDIFVVEPEGNQLRLQAEVATLVAEANRTPAQGTRKVLIVDRFHTATPSAAAALLKPIEEPTASTVWVLLSEQIPPAHVTIASRCVQVHFMTLTDHDVAAVLTNEGLVTGSEALPIAAAAGGNLDRARLLATDEQVAARRQAWWSIPDRLDGTGATVFKLVKEVRSLISDASQPLVANHKDELRDLAEREEMLGTRGSGRRLIEARHRREQRQLRTDELVFGLATLASRYRTIIVENQNEQAMSAIGRLRKTSAALTRNPNEALLLQSLLLDLSSFSLASTP